MLNNALEISLGMSLLILFISVSLLFKAINIVVKSIEKSK